MINNLTSDEISQALLQLDNNRQFYIQSNLEIVYTDGLPPIEFSLIETRVEQNRLEKSVNELRKLRNIYLLMTDKFMINDFPISSEKKQQIIEYRIALRNLPESLQGQTIDTNNLAQYLPNLPFQLD